MEGQVGVRIGKASYAELRSFQYCDSGEVREAFALDAKFKETTNSWWKKYQKFK